MKVFHLSCFCADFQFVVVKLKLNFPKCLIIMAETIVSDKLLVAKEKTVFGIVCKPILCIVSDKEDCLKLLQIFTKEDRDLQFPTVAC